MWNFMSLKCTNWLVKCNFCASDAVLALEQHFAHAQTYARECVCASASTQKAALKMRAA